MRSCAEPPHSLSAPDLPTMLLSAAGPTTTSLPLVPTTSMRPVSALNPAVTPGDTNSVLPLTFSSLDAAEPRHSLAGAEIVVEANETAGSTYASTPGFDPVTVPGLHAKRTASFTDGAAVSGTSAVIRKPPAKEGAAAALVGTIVSSRKRAVPGEPAAVHAVSGRSMLSVPSAAVSSPVLGVWSGSTIV